jgi:hypothetical protein
MRRSNECSTRHRARPARRDRGATRRMDIAKDVEPVAARAPPQLLAAAVVLGAALMSAPATAAHCPPGQFWRVSLNRCVGVHSRLARAYEPRPAIRLVTLRPAPPQPPAPQPDPAIKFLRERLAAPPALMPVDLLLSRAAALNPGDSR